MRFALLGIPIMGDLNMYGPGGYILTLSTDPEKAKEDVERLQEMSWVSIATTNAVSIADNLIKMKNKPYEKSSQMLFFSFR